MPGIKESARKLPELRLLWEHHLNDHVIALAWSPSGKKLAAASVSGEIAIYSDDGAARLTLPGHDFGATAVAWSADGQHFASAGQDGKIKLWDIAARSPRAVLEGGAAWVEHLAWNPLKSTPPLLASAAGRKLRLWSAAGELLREYPDQPSTVSAIRWKPGTQFLTSAAYGRVAIWTPLVDQPFKKFSWKGSILALEWSPHGKFIAAGGQDSTVHFWFEKTGKDLQMWGYPTKVRELSWSADSRYLATGGSPEVTIWDCINSPAGTKPIQLVGHEKFLTQLTYQRKGPLLASSSEDGRVVMWNPVKSTKALAGIGANSAIAKIAWSPDDRLLAAGSASGAVFALAAPE
ncbi:MAG: WD40 repeat domain-containing protein [Blastocatellia bacterium]|nr:WD40 repeat domain-containing protein [Blastocatellia bacterium]